MSNAEKMIRLNQALAETEILLIRSTQVSTEFQNLYLVNFYRSHITTLKCMIADLSN